MFMIFINNLYSYIFPKHTDILGNQNILCQGKSIDLSHYHNLVCFLVWALDHIVNYMNVISYMGSRLA